MKKLNNHWNDRADYDDVIEETEVDEFEIGQSYSDIPDKKIICKKCGSDKWIVGKGDYHTSVKCPNCKYEICIHEG